MIKYLIRFINTPREYVLINAMNIIWQVFNVVQKGTSQCSEEAGAGR